MLALRHRRLLSGLAALLCTVFIGWFVFEDFFPAPPSKVTMATAFAGASFEYYGERYRERFARANVKLELRETAGAVENLRLLQNPHSGVQIAFMIGGVSDGRHAPGILSLGTIYYTPFWIFYTSIEPIDRLSQLKGKRIAVGPEGSGTRFSAEKILAKGGVNSETATFLPFAGLTAAAALKDGKVDVVWFSGGPDSEAALGRAHGRRRTIERHGDGRHEHDRCRWCLYLSPGVRDVSSAWLLDCPVFRHGGHTDYRGVDLDLPDRSGEVGRG